ncbi:MAG: hypothetical protein J1F13_00505 [Prevotellaceae bacterium]|nr:hypothetical protein [Prevotellaceae bacterium]
MKHSFLPTLLCLAALLSSCHSNTEDIVSHKHEAVYAYEGMYTQTQFLPHKEDIPSVQTINSNTLPASKTGDEVYTFVLSNDIKQFYQASIVLRMKVLNNFYSDIAAGNFYNPDFARQYQPLLSPYIRKAVRQYAKAANPRNDIYAWQPFTPLPIASKIYTRYEITYDGDDWFSIKPIGDDTSVRLKVVLAGKEMHPVIAEISNPAFDINTGLGTSNNLGSGYTFNQDWEFGIFNNCKGNRNYWNYIAGIIYRHRAAGKSGNSFISEAELLAFADRIEQKREQFLQDFCADLTSTAYTAQTFSQKYDRNITRDVAKSCSESSQPLSLLQMFAPKDRKHYTITHIDRDWYGISSADSLNPDLKVQVVFYEREMRPLIVGLCNDALGIDSQSDFGLRRDAYVSGIQINKQ